ncbi:MAG: hypothetical protein H7644_10230 [Candidatus Heimdallarchaeota archaeon]|nr:hypothetical protein [Candidatus Heimdallarchaeota archaeon]MCK5144133.1 hypothetical protein [Candidatus Heimdallarchaeota archaeon]
MIQDIFLLEIIEFYLKFWLISLAMRWMLSFLPGRIFDLIRFTGNLARYPVKRLLYLIYGVQILETDFEKSLFKTEEVDDFDCRITSNVIAPLLILTYVGSFILYWANVLYDTKYSWISIILFILGFAIILMSAPDFREAEELLKTNLKSIFKWFAKLVFLALPTYFILHYLVGIEALSQGVFFIILLIPVYHHSRRNIGEKWVKSKKAKVLEADPFGE